jgi:septal ring factor EnvC (AmiA/AmiB activator)
MYGHCCSPQDIVNIQSKELRSLKRFIHDLTNKNNTLAQENAKLEEHNKSFQEEIKLLKRKITQLEEEQEKFVDCD